MNWYRSLSISACCLFAFAAIGCRNNATPENGEPESGEAERPVRLLVIDDPTLANVIERQWRARSSTELNVTQTTAEEFLESKSRRLAADMVIYPSGLLGNLVSRQLIEPIPPAERDTSETNRDDIFSLLRLRETKWGGQVYAVPFGSPQLTILYRRDVFGELRLSPPATWAEYQELVRQLAEHAASTSGDGAQNPTAAVEPLGPGWASQVLLARSAAYARHRSQYSALFDRRTMAPLIDGAPFIRALEELAQVAKAVAETTVDLSPADARKKLLDGNAAMVLSWPTSADTNVIASNGKTFPIGFAELPGSKDVFNFRQATWESRQAEEDDHVSLVGIAGRLGSLTRDGIRSGSAVGMLLWLGGAELGEQIASRSPDTTLYRQSHVSSVSRWVGEQIDAEGASEYGAVVQQAQNRPTSLNSIRIPGRKRYLEALDRAVHAVIAGESTAEAALQAAAKDWEEITDALGRDDQRNAYTQSIGLKL